MVRLTFYLMNYKGFKVLEDVIHSFGKEIIDKIITAKDEHLIKDYYSEIIHICQINSIPVFDHKEKHTVETKYAVVISWRWMIPESEHFRLIVLHDSLLPKYRGFNPLVTALINGDSKTGVTAVFASKEYDKGEIIYQAETNIDYPIKISSAIENITKNYIQIVFNLCNDIISHKELISYSQNEEEVSYSLWRDHEDYFINWYLSNTEILRFIDAVGYPYAGARSMVDNRLIIINHVEIIDDVQIVNRTPGKLIFFKDKKPVVVCGKGLLKICEMRDEQNNLFNLSKFRVRFR